MSDTRFDPFIHGTNSSIFAFLPKTDFQLMSPLEMLDEYQAAPLSGELIGGGFKIIGAGLIKDEVQGKPSFLQLQASYSSQELSPLKTAKYYASLESKCNGKENHLSQFQSARTSALRKAFAEINLLLIYFTRARQAHDSLEQVISKDEVQKLNQEIEATIQFYYFFQLLGTHIHPDFEALKKADSEESILNAVHQHLGFENIAKKIMEHKIDMKDILQNPTDENLQKALKVLELPQSKEVSSAATQYFRLQPNYSNINYQRKSDPYTFFRFSQNMGKEYCINSMLKDFLGRHLGPDEYFKPLREKAKNLLIALEDRARVFQKLVQAPQSAFQLRDEDKSYLNNRFPLIFLTENQDQLMVADARQKEYRCKSRLKLGQDIKMIATDTKEHCLEVMKFLDQHQIQGVEIFLISDLENNKYQKPQDQYAILKAELTKAAEPPAEEEEDDLALTSLLQFFGFPAIHSQPASGTTPNPQELRNPSRINEP